MQKNIYHFLQVAIMYENFDPNEDQEENPTRGQDLSSCTSDVTSQG